MTGKQKDYSQVSFDQSELNTTAQQYVEAVSYTHLDVYKRQVYVIGGAKQAGGAIPATKEGLEVGLKL